MSPFRKDIPVTTLRRYAPPLIIIAAAAFVALMMSFTEPGAQALPRGIPKRISALSTTVVTVNGSAAVIDNLQCFNPSNAAAYIQIFNLPNASTVTLGTTLPTQSFAIATTGQLAVSEMDAWYSTGIKIAATTTATGSTAPSAAVDCNATIK